MHTIANSHCRDLAAIVVAATLSMSTPAASNNGSTAKGSNRAGHEQQILQLMDATVSLGAVLRCGSSFRMKSFHNFSQENYFVREKAAPAETCWQYPMDQIFASAQSSPFPHRDAPRAREGTVGRNDVRGFRALAKLRE
jgi:hypothetical protein